MYRMKSVKELKIELYGRVQGVNFRNHVSRYANRLGLTGYVKNRADGSVVIIAQGRMSSLEELLSWCQRSVFPAKIIGMSYEWSKPSAQYEAFSVKREKRFVKDQAQSFMNLGKEVLGLSGGQLVPRHVVIIADGNRRWARSRGWKPWVGHQKAGKYERLWDLFMECKGMGIEFLSVWFWSTENWKRDKEEQDAIMDLFREGAAKAKKDIDREEIRFRHFGRRDRLPRDIVETIEHLEEASKKHRTFNLQLCIDYGGRDEIVRAFNGMVKDGVKEVTEEMVSQYLDSGLDIPDPDLIIRTSGEKRTSGIMPYQSVYAELYFTNVPFPEFDAEEFRRAILDYGARTRRFGGTVNADLRNYAEADLEDILLDKTSESPQVKSN